MESTVADPAVTDRTNGRPPPYRLRWAVAFVVLVANLMDVLDSTIVNVAGPAIRRDLGGGADTLQWLGAGYTLAFAVFLIAGARLGDIAGRRRMFLIGSFGFTLFSAACAAAPSVGALIALRALQGASGALMIPQGFGLMREAFTDDDEMRKAFSLFGPATGLPMLGAPVLAGALVDANLLGIGWRLVFLINVPIGAVALLFAFRSLPPGAQRPDMKLDTGAVALIGLALVAIIYPLIQGRSAGWPVWCFVVLAAGIALLIAFVFYERQHGGDALIEPTLLTNRDYLGGIAVVLALFGAFGGLLLCVSLYGQLGEHWSPVHAGLTLTPMIVGMVIGMVGTQPIAKALGRRILHLGIALVGLGTVLLAVVLTGVHSASSWDLLPGMLFVGVGVGTTFGQLFMFILTSVSRPEVGSASGVLEASQQLATSLGVAVLGTIFFSALEHHLPPAALQVTAWACLAPLTIAFLLVFRLPREAPDEVDGH